MSEGTTVRRGGQVVHFGEFRSMPRRAIPSPSALLCENCGYVLDGLNESGNCPECGNLIRESLPEQRIGSPWQQSPGIRSWFRTNYQTIRHPVRSVDTLREDRLRRTTALVAVNITIAAVMPALQPIYSRDLGHLVHIVVIVLCFNVFLGLSAVEYAGLRIFGKARRWRITHGLAATVCAHATAAWVLLGVLLFIGTWGLLWACVFIDLWLGTGQAPGTRDITALFTIVNGAIVLLGIILYSLLCGIGYKRMRFANAPRRPQPEPPPGRTIEAPKPGGGGETDGR